jgi:hypothetical protein
MALPSSGAISLLAIQNEFGGANPISISEYYKGGANVPNTTTNASVPTSGAISFNDFHGASDVPPLSGTKSGNAFGTRSTGGEAVTNSVTITPSGGVSPYTYAWSMVSGDSAINIDSPTSATTSFSALVSALNNDRTGIFKCRITDHDGTIFDVTGVSVELTFDSGA